MPQTAFETIDTMLESVQHELDDSDLRFKIRTTRQLLVLLEEQHEIGRDALEEATIDESTRENLRRLGYLE
jgi:hypothetical protein